MDLAEMDTQLKTAAHGKEYCGQCPNCGGRDRFHVKPGANNGRGGFMCRNCWDAEEMVTKRDGSTRMRGWGDEIDYLRHMRGMKSYQEAKAHLEELDGDIDTAIRRVKQLQHNVSGDWKSEAWQVKAEKYVKDSEGELAGSDGLTYLYSRGLKDKTIRGAHLGYTLEGDVPYLVIPHYTEGRYWKINRRDLRAGADPKYKAKAGSTNESMYAGDVLRRGKRPVFLVEGEIDALSIIQEAGDLVSAVATGSTEGARTLTWICRLARAERVFLAFDREEKGDKAAEYWLERLDNAVRWRPLVHDANDMLTGGYSIRGWVQSALAAAQAPQRPLEDTRMQDRPCARCGGHSAVFSPIRDLWVCPCIEEWQRAPIPISTYKRRPTVSMLPPGW